MTATNLKQAIHAEIVERATHIQQSILEIACSEEGLIPMEQLTSALLDVLEACQSISSIKTLRLNPEIVSNPLCVGGWDTGFRLKELEIVAKDADLSAILANH